MTLTKSRSTRRAELEALTASINQFIAREIAPHVDAWETNGAPPLSALVRQLGELGVLAPDLPEDEGGLGLDFVHALTVSERLGAIASRGLVAAFAAHMELALPLLHATGDEESRARWLGPLARGEQLATALPLDVDVVPGLGTCVPGALDADVLVQPGVVQMLKSRIAAPRQLGMWAARAGLLPDDVSAPAKGIDPVRLAGWRDRARVREAARALCWMERLLSQTADYTGRREVFGKPLLTRQAVRLRLAELHAEVDALRALCHQTAQFVDEMAAPASIARLAAGAQWKAARLSHRVADECLQLWGGMGFMAESPTARAWRDGIHACMGRQVPLLGQVADALEIA